MIFWNHSLSLHLDKIEITRYKKRKTVFDNHCLVCFLQRSKDLDFRCPENTFGDETAFYTKTKFDIT